MIKAKKGISLLIALILLGIYVISPYVAAWKMIHAVREANAVDMEYHIDFSSVQNSAKQQIERSIDKKIQQDPMMNLLKAIVRPVMDQLIEDLIDPEKLSKFIQQGSLKPSKTLNQSVSEAAEVDPTKLASWYAFFIRPNRFLIQVNELALYMEVKDWHWQVVAIGVESLMDGGNVVDEEKGPIKDVIDPHPPVKPMVLNEEEIEELKLEIGSSFHIDSNWEDTAKINGYLMYTSIRDSIKPVVSWGAAIDEDGQNNLGVFSEEKHEKRQKYNSENMYYQGIWTDEIPKLNTNKKITSAMGICHIEIPSKIEEFNFTVENLNEIELRERISVTFTSLKSGHVSYSVYHPFDSSLGKPIAIIRNSEGQTLKTKSTSSMSPEKPINDYRFTEPMRVTTRSIKVTGTPVSVELYYVVATTPIDIPVVAYAKPEVVFGELKEKIKQVKLARPSKALPFNSLGFDELESLIKISFKEKENWQGVKRKFLEISFPEMANSYFSRLDYKQLDIFKDTVLIPYKESTWNKGKTKILHFLKPSKDWSEVDADFDHLKGHIEVKYPAEMEIFTVRQGETLHGVSLSNETVTLYASFNKALPLTEKEKKELNSSRNRALSVASVSLDFSDFSKVGLIDVSIPNAKQLRIEKVRNASIPDYMSVFSTRSISAYDKKGREIEYLDLKSARRNEDESILFWGKPAWIEVKRITKWYEIILPVDFTDADLIIEN